MTEPVKETPGASAAPDQPSVDAAAILESCVDVVWATDAEWRLTHLSDGFERVTGFSRADSLGRRARDMPWFRSSDEELALRDVLIAELRPFRSHRFPFVHPDGRMRLLSISGGPQFDSHGRYVGYAGVAADITSATRTEEMLATIAKAVGGATGADHLRGLVRALTEVLGAEAVYIGRIGTEYPDRIDTVAVHTRAGPGANFSYMLAGTPCADVVAGALCVHPTGVQRLFPDDRMLVDMGIDGYAGAPLRDSRGAPNGLLVVLKASPISDIDLTRNLLQVFAGRAAAELERQTVEAELARSREYLLQSQRLGRTGYIVSDHRTRRVTWSDTMFDIRGVPPRPWFGFDEAVAFIHPDDRAMWDATRQRCVDTRQPYDIELRIVRPDGAVIWEHSIGLPQFDAEGRLAQLVVFVQDVTQRHEAEAENRKLALVAARTGNLVVVTNPNHDIEWVNEAFTRITGYSFAEALGRKPRDTIMGPGADPAAVAFTRQRLNSGEGFRDYEVRCTAKDGRRYWLNLEALPIRDAQGRIVQHIGVGTDVTAQKDAERRIAESQALLLEAQQVGKIGYVLSDEVLGRAYWSETLFDLLGLPQRPYMTLAESLAVIPGGDRQRYLEERSAAIRERRDFSVDIRVLRADGTMMWARGVGHPRYGADGELTGVLLILQDVTGQKEAELALREKEREQRAILDNAPIAIFLKDRDSRYRLVNRTFEQWYGVRGEDIYGTQGETIYAPDAVRFNIASDREPLRLGKVSQIERATVAARGGIEHGQVTKFPIRDADGAIVGIAGFLADITARKRAEEALRHSEERFRALIEHSNDLVAVIGLDGTLRYHSPSVPESLGFGARQFTDRSIMELVHPEDVPHLTDALRSIVGSAVARASGEGRVRHQDGSWRHIAWVARNASDIPGVGGIIVNGRDVTDAKALEEQLLQSQKMEAVGQLAGGIAHDFNNIIGVILGFGDFLLEDLPPESRLHGFAGRIVSAGNRAKQLVQQILAFSRHTGVQRRPEDLAAIVRETAELLRGSLPSSTRLEIGEAPTGLVGTVNAGQIAQVVMNLCLNANDALNGEPGRIVVALRGCDGAELEPAAADGEVRIGQIDAGRRYARLAVTDTGSGMAPEVLRRIFEPFYTTKERGRGTGLGLAVVHGIVTDLGGACTVSSRPGTGTRFEILIPLSAAVLAAGADDRDIQALRGRERVLVVDDEVDITDMLSIGLERLGYEVGTCSDPVEALRIFETQPDAWDVVISDQVMPNMKGTAMLAAMRARHPALTLILCTGFSDGTSEATALADGIGAFFLKPVPVESLAAAIRRLRQPAGT